MSDITSDVRFEDDLKLASEDNSIITYVAGSHSRSLMKKMPKGHSLDCCISMITRGTSISLATDEEGDSSLQDEEFFSLVSRGGLQHTSDCLFITCVHSYQFYERVRGDKNFDAVLMGSSNSREVFASIFVKKILECQDTSALVVARCDEGQTSRPFIQTIAYELCNDMSKNFGAYKNDKVHASTKKLTSTPVNSKKSSVGQKILKLT